MIKKAPLKTLGLFAPSTHYYNGEYLYGILDKKLDKIEAIAHLRYQNDLIHEYCLDRGIISLSFPVNKNFLLPYSVLQIVKVSDVICAIDNGRGKSIELIKKICAENERDLTILSCPSEESIAVEFCRELLNSESELVSVRTKPELKIEKE